MKVFVVSEQIVYGLHAVTALLKQHARPIKKIFLHSDRQDQRVQLIQKLALEQKISIERVSNQDMIARFSQIKHQGVVAQVGALPQYHQNDLKLLLHQCKNSPLILILDGITDPHNLGACLRSAEATGVDFVILPKDKSVGITPVVSKVACGAAEMIPIVRVTNLVRTLDLLKEEGIWIYGAAVEGSQTLYSFDLKGPIALVFGAEGSGMRRLTREHCDGLFSIPMVGTVESLNISVAAGVSLYEVHRQRLTHTV